MTGVRASPAAAVGSADSVCCVVPVCSVVRVGSVRLGSVVRMCSQFSWSRIRECAMR